MDELIFHDIEDNSLKSRIGGSALIGEMTWPTAPDGSNLVLIASIRVDFINPEIKNNEYISIFSYYSKNEYFLDKICYHGDPSELEEIKSGTTMVIWHENKTVASKSLIVPSKEIKKSKTSYSENWIGSKVDGEVILLQNENLHLENFKYCLQIYSCDFPGEYKDIFGCIGAMGYLYLDWQRKKGLFFVQAN